MTILELLPKPAKLNEGNELTNVLEKFTSLETQKETFSLTSLQEVLTGGESLSISNSFTLVSETINNLDKIRAKLPSKPGEITDTLKQELMKMLQNGGKLGGLLAPINQFTEGITPLLGKLDNFSESVNDINEIVSKLPTELQDLKLTNLPQQLDYFLQVLEVFNVSDVSPFKELKAQIKTLQEWLSTDNDALTNQFQAQIQALTTELPKQLNQVMQVAVEAVYNIQNSLELKGSLNRYGQALKAVEDIDLNGLNKSKISEYLKVLGTEFNIVEPIANNLTDKTQIALAKMEGFDVSYFSDELRYALQNIFTTISPTSPSALSEISQQIQKLIGGLEVGTLQSVIAQIDQQIDQLIGKVDFSTFPNQVEKITEKISSTAGTLDRGLVNLAAFLSNLVKELGNLIESVNLSKISENIKEQFEKLTTQVDGLLSKVKTIPDELNKLVGKLQENVDKIKFDAIREKIAKFLSQITSVLNDPQIQHIRTSAQQGIEAIANALSNVSLKPVFERVLSEIADAKSKLATVNVSQLNEVLKKALTLALDKIREINFAKDVAEKLKGEFQKKIINRFTNLLNSLQEQYKEIVKQIEQFKPGDWVAAQLASPFDNLMAKLKEIEPSKLLKPLENLYNSLLDKLETFSPTDLLSPLIKLHSQLMTAVRSLSPQDLLNPLNNLLKEVTSLLDKLGIDGLILRIRNITKIKKLLDISPSTELKDSSLWGTLKNLRIQGNNLLQDAEGQVNQYLDKLIELVPEVDMEVLKGALNGLEEAINNIKKHINNPDVLSDLKQIPENCKIIEFQDELTELTKRWLAQKKRFNEFTPPSDAEEDYKKLKAKLQSLSPIELLGEAATSVERFTASLNLVQNELIVSQKALSNLLASNLDKLTALLPKDGTLAGFKKLLRDGLEEQIGLPAKELLGLLKQQLVQFDQVFASLQMIASKFESPIKILTVIPDSIEAICETLTTAKNKITNLNFNFLEEELQGVIDKIIGKLDDLNPESLLDGLDGMYKNLLNTLKGLYPNEAINEVDSVYKDTILTKLEELHPNKTIAEPLDKEYEKIILQLSEQLNVDKIFDVLTKKLDTLEKELDDGLKKTGTAFNQLLQALPL